MRKFANAALPRSKVNFKVLRIKLLTQFDDISPLESLNPKLKEKNKNQIFFSLI